MPSLGAARSWRSPLTSPSANPKPGPSASPAAASPVITPYNPTVSAQQASQHRSGEPAAQLRPRPKRLIHGSGTLLGPWDVAARPVGAYAVIHSATGDREYAWPSATQLLGGQQRPGAEVRAMKTIAAMQARRMIMIRIIPTPAWTHWRSVGPCGAIPHDVVLAGCQDAHRLAGQRPDHRPPHLSFYRAHPELRAELATPDALDRISNGRAVGQEQP